MSTDLILLGTAGGPAPKRTRSAPARAVVVDGAAAQAAGVRMLVLSHLVPTDVAIPDDTWRKHAAQGFDGEVVVGHDLMVL